MTVKLLTEHHLEFLSLKGDCRGSSESTLVKMTNCWKSHVEARIIVKKKTTKTERVASRALVSCLCVSNVQLTWLRPKNNYWCDHIRLRISVCQRELNFAIGLIVKFQNSIRKKPFHKNRQCIHFGPI